ncbi:MAG TPA: sigma-70 family RNA polymerase sigma factor [Gaiellaceae bacterium]|nr:sigma-70 family RNA polymerase sigma factor [Gaiellaceae bacterium]
MTALSPSPPAAGRALDAAGLFERYGQELYRFCLGRLRNPEDAADALQNTFLRVHVALEKGTVPQFEAAWLYKIAHNVCLSRREQAGRRSAHETPSDLEELEWSAAAPEHDHDRLEGLADALADLPHNLRQSLLLREWQGLSYVEIAEALDTTVPAVETLLYRARKQLAAALEQGGRKARAALGGLLDLLGVRALLGRLSAIGSGVGAAKLAVGAALVIAGGSALAASQAAGSHHTRTPAHGGSRASVVRRPLSSAHTGRSVADTGQPSTEKAPSPDGGATSVTLDTPSPASGSAASPAATTGTHAAPASAPQAKTTTASTATTTAGAAGLTLVEPPTVDGTSSPTLPTVPTAPTTPIAPTLPQSPAAPTLPALPSAPTLTTEPTSPDLPQAPASPAVPQTPTLPQAPALPSAPTLPGLGG